MFPGPATVVRGREITVSPPTAATHGAIDPEDTRRRRRSEQGGEGGGEGQEEGTGRRGGEGELGPNPRYWSDRSVLAKLLEKHFSSREKLMRELSKM